MSDLTVRDLGTLFDGPHATPKRIESGPYFLNIASLNGGRLELDQSDHVSEMDFQKWTKRVEPTEGDLLFSYETRLGEAALMPADVRACLGRRMALIRPNRSVVDPKFLLYYYLSPGFQRTIEQHTIHGATVNRISLSTMGAWPVSIPSLDEQQAIAQVLGALDDKIAANTKLAATADALATTQFHKAVHGIAVSDQNFGDIAMVSGGGTPSTTVLEYWDGDIHWATPTDVTPLQGPYLETTNRMISHAGLSACASSLYPPGSILMTSRATIGAFAIAQTPMAVNQGFIVVQPTDPALRYWVFHEMRSRVDEFISLANGATFLELNRANFKKIKVRLADSRVMEEFGRQAETLHAIARNALRENAKLAETRDALLPPLMSGKLRVRDAEKILENAGV
ncbi:restriction endonuclease subunit S [Arthrobacter sp. NicSoilC5]|uniref:restriction endonuclease subunit S n=1 Tax=Arthrobacter sp. NicSoilC5 TaxID=2831000 RepID=UPI001CC349EC|nr:restriction endonuclease subunit S [Arthrobacter sp. NicSoilC5]BCW78853.1 hypothetical protein NicSoilC5_08720 [Arthrobacter sp. NicSoilC5]